MYCSNCGSEGFGSFCNRCGAKLLYSSEQATSLHQNNTLEHHSGMRIFSEILWFIVRLFFLFCYFWISLFGFFLEESRIIDGDDMEWQWWSIVVVIGNFCLLIWSIQKIVGYIRNKTSRKQMHNVLSFVVSVITTVLSLAFIWAWISLFIYS